MIFEVDATWEHSSAGRAPALQAGGHRFEPCCSHHSQFGPVVPLVRTPACHAGGRRFEPVPGRHFVADFIVRDGFPVKVCIVPRSSFPFPEVASVAQLVEQRTENPRVVGSTPTGGTTTCGGAPRELHRRVAFTKSPASMDPFTACPQISCTCSIAEPLCIVLTQDAQLRM